MGSIHSRRLLRAVGVVFLLSLFPLSNTYGVAATITICVLSLACFMAASFIKLDIRPSGDIARPKTPYVCPYKVEFDASEIRVLYEGTLKERANWSELQAVGIIIDGSYLPAPWWLLSTSPKTGCRFPSEAKGGGEMLEALQARLPGFDNMAVIEAMGLMEGGRLVWSRERAQARVE